MFPVGAVHAQPEGIRALPGGEAPGRGNLREGHAGRTQKERLVQDSRSKVMTIACQLV